ncbi:MAG: nucleoside deaminase [Alloprevotella sp.]|nr:nucleoside deaminase [Alloprevotella sp.]
MKAKHSPESFMREAIKLSAESVRSGGGPFGAVIVRNGEIIARGENRVTVCNDPTAHAEVSAIREAAARLGTYDLSGCEIYSSCEPCPMCLGAIYWARLDRLYYAGTRADAANVGFDDAHIYEELPLDPSQRELPTESLLREEAQLVFEAWASKLDKKEY